MRSVRSSVSPPYITACESCSNHVVRLPSIGPDPTEARRSSLVEERMRAIDYLERTGPRGIARGQSRQPTWANPSEGTRPSVSGLDGWRSAFVAGLRSRSRCEALPATSSATLPVEERADSNRETDSGTGTSPGSRRSVTGRRVAIRSGISPAQAPESSSRTWSCGGPERVGRVRDEFAGNLES